MKNLIMLKPVSIVLLLLLFISTIVASEVNKTGNPWVAVHDFSVSPKLKKMGVNGWRIAGVIENELVQKGDYRIVTRSKIAKVLKEKNLTSSSSLEPEAFAEMIGAEYIITGQIQNSGNKVILIGKLIDVSNETGEVEKSFDLDVTGSSLEQAVTKLPDLYEEMADFLTMTPGEFLDLGIHSMNQGNYVNAVKAFQEVKNLIPVDKIKRIMQSPDFNKVIALDDSSIDTPGRLLDYGLKQMNNNHDKKAAEAFKKFEEITPFEQIKQLFEVGKMLKKAENLVKKQKENLIIVIETSTNLFIKAKEAQDEIESQMPPEELCDKAINNLENIILNPKIHLTSEEKLRIEELISRIQIFKKTLFAGPSKGKTWRVPGIEIAMIPIETGSFEMGEEVSEEYSDYADNPKHKVNINNQFWIGKHEVTIGQFLEFLKNVGNSGTEFNLTDVNESINFSASYTPIKKNYAMKRGKGKTWGNKKQPIVGVSWQAAVYFCQWLTLRESKEKRLPKNYVYRLPTEAEWEYSCRSGSATDYSFGKDEPILLDYAWYRDNSSRKTSTVGKKKPNSWGVYDMHGNVWEWCNDWYDETYITDEINDPFGPESSPDNLKVLRGGSFASSPSDLKSSTRYSFRYKGSKKNIGFRIVCAPEI